MENVTENCGNPENFFRGGGGGGVQGQQRGSNGFIIEKSILFQGPEGGPTFSRGVQHFPGGGVQMLISIETHITCDPDPLSPPPPLDPRMRN